MRYSAASFHRILTDVVDIRSVYLLSILRPEAIKPGLPGNTVGGGIVFINILKKPIPRIVVERPFINSTES